MVTSGQDTQIRVRGVAESLFRVGLCLPSGPYVTEDDVRYIVEAIKSLVL